MDQPVRLSAKTAGMSSHSTFTRKQFTISDNVASQMQQINTDTLTLNGELNLSQTVMNSCIVSPVPLNGAS